MIDIVFWAAIAIIVFLTVRNSLRDDKADRARKALSEAERNAL